jgi:hypothetical protein
MPQSHVYDIVDPALYRPAMRGGEVELLVVGSGEFRAELTPASRPSSIAASRSPRVKSRSTASAP